MRRATLSVDSDLTPDADLLVRAAHGAVWLADLPLPTDWRKRRCMPERVQEPNFVRAHALSWLGRGEEAEAILAEIPTNELTDHDRARLRVPAGQQHAVGAWRPRARERTHRRGARATPARARTYIDAFLTVYWFAIDEPDAAIAGFEKPCTGRYSRCRRRDSLGARPDIRGRGARDRSRAAADAGYAVATRSLDAPHMRFNIADANISALLLSGQVADALDVAERTREEAANLPGAAQLLGAAVAGRAALGAGDLRSACLLLEQAAEGLSASHPIGWGYRYQRPTRPRSQCVVRPARRPPALAALDSMQRRFRSLDYERSLARAWVAAGQGAVSEAISIVLSAAQRARATGRFAAEVLCLQTAAQFGDRSARPRLRELESIVEGPRVGLAARFADALRDGDAAELASVSEEFERMGDPVAAIDAAAHAAIAYRRQDQRGSALGCSTRADALADTVRRNHTGASSGDRKPAADRPRTRDRDADR